MSLQLIQTTTDQQQIDNAAFAASYEGWSLRNDITLPDEQLRIICGIFFNFGVVHGEAIREKEIAALEGHILDLQHDMASMETTDDDGLSERERLTRGGFDGY